MHNQKTIIPTSQDNITTPRTQSKIKRPGAGLRTTSTKPAPQSQHQRPASNADPLRPRGVIGPIHEPSPSKSRTSADGIEYHTGRKTEDRPIRGSSNDTRYRTSSHQIPAIGNNSPLGDGDACRGWHLDRVRLPCDQSIIGLNGFLVVFSRSFRLILGLKLRHLRLLRTLRNRMRCSHSLTRRTKEHSDRHNKSHHRSTNPPQHSSHTHRDLSSKSSNPGRIANTPPFTTIYRLGKWRYHHTPPHKHSTSDNATNIDGSYAHPLTVVFTRILPANPTLWHTRPKRPHIVCFLQT